MTFKARLALAINRAARISLHSIELVQAHQVATIKAKATTFAANNPAPRALYLLG